MRDIGYKKIDKHIVMHRGIVENTLQLQRIASNNEPEATKEMIVFLGDWLLHHVIEKDKKYSVGFETKN
jgi:hemerythrin